MASEDFLEFVVKGAFLIVFGALALIVLAPFAAGFALISYFGPKMPVISLSPKDIKAMLFRWYYRLFPGQLRKKERREQADLLLEFEEISKEKACLGEELRHNSWLLQVFAKKILEIDDKAFKNRAEGKTAYSAIESFDVSELSDYESIKKRAVAWENAVFKLYAIRKKLELFGITKDEY